MGVAELDDGGAIDAGEGELEDRLGVDLVELGEAAEHVGVERHLLGGFGHRRVHEDLPVRVLAFGELELDALLLGDLDDAPAGLHAGEAGGVVVDGADDAEVDLDVGDLVVGVQPHGVVEEALAAAVGVEDDGDSPGGFVEPGGRVELELGVQVRDPGVEQHVAVGGHEPEAGRVLQDADPLEDRTLLLLGCGDGYGKPAAGQGGGVEVHARQLQK